MTCFGEGQRRDWSLAYYDSIMHGLDSNRLGVVVVVDISVCDTGICNAVGGAVSDLSCFSLAGPSRPQHFQEGKIPESKSYSRHGRCSPLVPEHMVK